MANKFKAFIEKESQEEKKTDDDDIVKEEVIKNEQQETLKTSIEKPIKRNKKVTSISLPPALYKDVTGYCESHGVSLSSLTAMLLKNFLDRENVNLIEGVKSLER